MKTPQEEAEEISHKIAITLFGGEPNSEFGKEIVADEALTIRKQTSLAELIAVARTASKAQANAAIFCDEDVELQDALQALRATGKVEL